MVYAARGISVGVVGRNNANSAHSRLHGIAMTAVGSMFAIGAEALNQ
jgi:hypothetical protein